MLLDSNEQKVYQKYANLILPRHTSYPAPPRWSDMSSQEHQTLLYSNLRQEKEVSLYVHVPFCKQLCFYCGCTKQVIPDSFSHQQKQQSLEFLEGLKLELSQLHDVLDGQTVRKIHFGGGTPTFLPVNLFSEMMLAVFNLISPTPQTELSIEVDPRVTSPEHFKILKSFGFNRISLGIQDMNETVQHAVNRLQSRRLITETLELCRDSGFKSINMDLIYGLPNQTMATMEETLEFVLSHAPNRVAFYRLAVIPELFKWQKRFKQEDMPNSVETMKMMMMAIERFTQAHYNYIGFDHFARDDDSLSIEWKQQSLFRNFQGMSTNDTDCIIGVGPSAVTTLPGVYLQNDKSVKHWRNRLERGFATEKGFKLDSEDLIRQELIQHIYARGNVKYEYFNQLYNIDFKSKFADELKELEKLQSDGLVTILERGFKVTRPLGQMLSRCVASVFDAYLPPQHQMPRSNLPFGSQTG